MPALTPQSKFPVVLPASTDGPKTDPKLKVDDVIIFNVENVLLTEFIGSMDTYGSDFPLLVNVLKHQWPPPPGPLSARVHDGHVRQDTDGFI